MDTKIIPLYMLSTRDPPETKGYIQTESEELGKDISCKWRLKERSRHLSDKINFEIKAMKRDKDTT